ncbi:uncharacterized protein LOC119766337 [Culex quinquefasciatus]|nr:uncharacterized protein LOC119766337 [Culex quinquefasciatus]
MAPVFFFCKNLISEDQHGFMPSRSTTTNLLTFTTFVTDSFTARSQTDAVYTDLSAAFDKLNHAIAIAKLERMGIGGTLLSWFQSYLADRKINVKIGDCLSAALMAFSGIAQEVISDHSSSFYTTTTATTPSLDRVCPTQTT